MPYARSLIGGLFLTFSGALSILIPCTETSEARGDDRKGTDEPKAGEERSFEIASGVKMVFCWIPAGEAQLGSPKAERDAVWEQVKEERLGEKLKKLNKELLDSEAEEKRGKFKTSGFWMGKYPVTQEEWKALMLHNPSDFDGKNENKAKGLSTGRHPVDSVNWNVICKDYGGSPCFLEKLNKVGGISKVFGRAGKFVLPHEDEWEYACRGGRGNGRAYYWGDSLSGTEANCNGEYPFGTLTEGLYLGRTCSVDFTNGGKYAKHPWGLCHMCGNVSQWCSNMYDDEDYVQRGGSLLHSARWCRSACRDMSSPKIGADIFGFRVLVSLEK